MKLFSGSLQAEWLTLSRKKSKMAGASDYKYGFSFLNVINDLLAYRDSGKLEKHHDNSIKTVMDYLENLITMDRITQYNLRYDYKKIKGGIEEAMNDTADFNKIMPKEYKNLQVWDKQMQTLDSVLKGEANKEDVKEAIDFFETLSNGYVGFVLQNRHDIFDEMGAWA